MHWPPLNKLHFIIFHCYWHQQALILIPISRCAFIMHIKLSTTLTLLTPPRSFSCRLIHCTTLGSVEFIESKMKHAKCFIIRVKSCEMIKLCRMHYWNDVNPHYESVWENDNDERNNHVNYTIDISEINLQN